jgi:hypothetical protein
MIVTFSRYQRNKIRAARRVSKTPVAPETRIMLLTIFGGSAILFICYIELFFKIKRKEKYINQLKKNICEEEEEECVYI